jgi:indolepyruvate ferredoxin oxidoreductase
MTKVLAALTADNLDAAVRVAELPDLVRGYEELKLERVAEFRRRLAQDVPAVTGAGGGRGRRR